MFHLIILLAGAVVAQQGQALRLAVPNDAGIQAVQSQWEGEKVPYAQRGNEWIAVIGVDLEIKPGEYPSEILITRDGKQERQTLTVQVQKVAFPTTELKVPDKYVQLNAR